jgi:urease alpha subunit
MDLGVASLYGLRKRVVAVKGTRKIGKKDMKYNDATPKMHVDPESYEVLADGVACTCEPAAELPLTQNYFLF